MAEYAVCLCFCICLYLYVLLSISISLCLCVCICPSIYWIYYCVDLWVIKIKKSMILCARGASKITWTKRETHQAARICERFVYSIVKTTWFYDYLRTRGTKVCGLFFLDCAFRVLIGWAGKFRSRGWLCLFVCLSVCLSVSSAVFEGYYTPPISKRRSASRTVWLGGKYQHPHIKWIAYSAEQKQT